MKVVHFNTQDRSGGAGRAVYRLHKKLLDLGVDSNLLVSQLSYNDDPTVKEADTTLLSRLKRKYIRDIENLPFRINSFYREAEFSVNWLSQINIKNNPFIDDADIIGLYWIGRGYISPNEVGKFNKPIVWRLSDTWPFTGGCHYPGSCSKYTDSCGACPKIHSNQSQDFTYHTIKKKIKCWESLDITVIAPSKWIANAASKSNVFRNRPVQIIPSGIDHQFFTPVADKEVAKSLFHIKKKNKVLLFGAAYANSDSRKGYDLLLDVLEELDKTNETLTLLIFGNNRNIKFPKFRNLDSVFLNTINSPYLLRMAYCAADAFIAPYRDDNLPNTVIESMSCGTPTIAFNIGGLPELVDHKVNGYLVPPYDIKEMAKGVLWVIDIDNSLSEKAREKIINGKFTIDNQAVDYLNLYKKILNNERAR